MNLEVLGKRINTNFVVSLNDIYPEYKLQGEMPPATYRVFNYLKYLVSEAKEITSTVTINNDSKKRAAEELKSRTTEFVARVKELEKLGLVKVVKLGQILSVTLNPLFVFKGSLLTRVAAILTYYSDGEDIGGWFGRFCEKYELTSESLMNFDIMIGTELGLNPITTREQMRESLGVLSKL